MPEGSGVGWRVVLVNHDVDVAAVGAPSTERWRASSPSLFQLDYESPVVVVVSVGPGRSPAVGGFLVHVYGSNLSARPPFVVVGGLPCLVSVAGFGHDSVTCTAPPRQMDRDNSVVVTVNGQPSNAVPLDYDPPVVTAVLPDVLDAARVDDSLPPPLVRCRSLLEGA